MQQQTAKFRFAVQKVRRRHVLSLKLSLISVHIKNEIIADCKKAFMSKTNFLILTLETKILLLQNYGHYKAIKTPFSGIVPKILSTAQK